MLICRDAEAGTAYTAAQNIVRLVIDRSESENVEVVLNIFPPGGLIPAHAHHEREQVYYVISGTGTVCIGNETARINPGTVVLVPRGLEHSTTADTTQDLRYIVVNVFAGGMDRGGKTYAENFARIVSQGTDPSGQE